tara:strand:+ start:985 stop:1275 length:291 start_codon:yes stop_codon:yes gene_type:complete
MDVFIGQKLQVVELGYGIGEWGLEEWGGKMPLVLVTGWTEHGRILVVGADGVPLGGVGDGYGNLSYTAACCPETFGYEGNSSRIFKHTIPKGDSEV